MALSWRSPERDTSALNTKLSSKLYLEWLEKPQIQRNVIFTWMLNFPYLKRSIKQMSCMLSQMYLLVHELEVKVKWGQNSHTTKTQVRWWLRKYQLSNKAAESFCPSPRKKKKSSLKHSLCKFSYYVCISNASIFNYELTLKWWI